MLPKYNNTMHIEEPWFSLIKYGTKKIEGRKASPTWIILKQNDIIKVTCDDNTYYVRVTDIKKYNGRSEYDPLSEYLIMEGINNTLPGVETLSKARDIYLRWSSLDEIERCGMLAIHVEVVNDMELYDSGKHDTSNLLCSCMVYYDHPFEGVDFHYCCDYCITSNRPSYSDDLDSIID